MKFRGLRVKEGVKFVVSAQPTITEILDFHPRVEKTLSRRVAQPTKATIHGWGRCIGILSFLIPQNDQLNILNVLGTASSNFQFSTGYQVCSEIR